MAVGMLVVVEACFFLERRRLAEVVGVAGMGLEGTVGMGRRGGMVCQGLRGSGPSCLLFGWVWSVGLGGLVPCVRRRDGE